MPTNDAFLVRVGNTNSPHLVPTRPVARTGQPHGAGGPRPHSTAYQIPLTERLLQKVIFRITSYQPVTFCRTNGITVHKNEGIE